MFFFHWCYTLLYYANRRTRLGCMFPFLAFLFRNGMMILAFFAHSMEFHVQKVLYVQPSSFILNNLATVISTYKGAGMIP